METSRSTKNAQSKPNVEKAARVFLNDGKKLANELYEDSIYRVSEAEDHIKEYANVKKIMRMGFRTASS